MNKIGRRWALAGSLLMCAFTCFAGGFIPHGNTGTDVNWFLCRFSNYFILNSENTWAVVTLFLFGKLGITSAFSTSYVHTAEMLPTVIRSIGVGSASTVARIGALIAPFVPLLVCSLFFFYIESSLGSIHILSPNMIIMIV